MKTNKQFKWTVFFLMRAVKEFHLEAVKLIELILQSWINGNEISVIICLNILAENIPAKFPRGAKHPLTGLTTVFYKVTISKQGTSMLELLDEVQNFDIKDPAIVTKFFKETILDNHTADRYMLFTWDHGQPFGIFGGGAPQLATQKSIKTDERSGLVANSQLYQPLMQFSTQWNFPKSRIPGSTYIANAKSDARQFPTSDDLDLLTTTELANAIRWAWGEKKIDVLIMMNCYLQFFDTGYALNDNAEYLIAFETEMYPIVDLDYRNIIELLSSNPDTTSETVSKQIVHSFAFHRDDIIDPALRKLKNKTAFFANKLSWYPCLAKLIDELAIRLIKELPRYYNNIAAALKKCGYISPTIAQFALIDFRNFLTCLYNEAPALIPLAEFNFINYAIDKVVISAFIGDDFINEQGARFVSPSAFSIYFPENVQMYKTEFQRIFMEENLKNSTEFTQKFNWDNFIYQFILFQDNCGN